MRHSLTYYITIWVIKLKGIKANFSKNPINVNNIRKEDVLYPKGSFFSQHIFNKFQVLGSEITEIGTDKSSDKLLIFIHGGAFISGPAQHHWDAIKTIAKNTNHKIWLCNYPKAPENTIELISKNIDQVYVKALENYKPEHISLIGDSVGGTLVTALTQRLIIQGSVLPKKIILISPVVDASMTNPKIEALDKLDPMLSKNGVLSAKKMCAGNLDLKNAIISPLYGSFEGFPQTILFMAQRDIMYADAKLMEQKLKEANVNLEVIEGEAMPHIWPLLPVMKEAKTALLKIIDFING